MRRKVIFAFIAIIGVAVLFLTSGQTAASNRTLSEYYILSSHEKMHAPNVVTSIYLYFRYYDTLFETLILMFSIIGIITLSIHEGDDEDE